MAKEYQPGDIIEKSGIYHVTHDPAHVEQHDVTCLAGTVFPSCRGCKNPRFVLLQAAHTLQTHEAFHR